MISSRAPGGREPREHRKFEIIKRVTIIRGDLEIEGVLQDISVGGAAIECSAALDAGLSDEIDIEDMDLSANVVRRIDSDVVAVRFTITEAWRFEWPRELRRSMWRTHVSLIRGRS